VRGLIFVIWSNRGLLEHEINHPLLVSMRDTITGDGFNGYI